MQKELTYTTSFLLPAIEINVKEFMKFGFINAYLSDRGIEEPEKYDKHIFCLFNTGFSQVHSEFYEQCREYPNYVMDYDPDYGKTMYVYRIHDKYLNELSKFKEGKYSEFSKSYIKKNFPLKSDNYKICMKDKFLKAELERIWDIQIEEGAEIWSKPTLSREAYRYNEVESWT